jgi:hypothetical protein
VYIGLTKNYRVRKAEHLWFFRKGTHPNTKLRRFITKYGRESLLFDGIILPISPERDITAFVEAEKNSIKEHNSYKKGFNCTEGGELPGSWESMDPIERENRRVKARQYTKTWWSTASTKKRKERAKNAKAGWLKAMAKRTPEQEAERIKKMKLTKRLNPTHNRKGKFKLTPYKDSILELSKNGFSIPQILAHLLTQKIRVCDWTLRTFVQNAKNT